jgi:hypothetical protein
VTTKRFAILALVLSFALLAGACSKSLNVADLELEEDLKQVGEAETLQPVSEVSCPETIDDPAAGTAFSCELTLEDGSTATANLELEEDEDGAFQATYVGIDQ